MATVITEKKTDKKAAPKNRVRPVNGFVMTVLYYGVRLYLLLCGVRVKTVNKVGKPESPSIVLCNHSSFIDFIYAAALLRKYKPHFIVARLYFYNTALGWLLRTVGAFPKSMFAMDMENAKNCLTVLKNQEILAMMPEARLSTTGRFEDIQENTYSFIKKSGVPVYTIKFCGDYLADPKWGRGFRRGSLVEAELDLLFTAEQVRSLPMEEMKRRIEERLTYDEFRWLQQRPELRYRSRRMAEGLENILTTCPVCHRKYTLKTKKDKVFCECCGYLTSVDHRYGFTSDFRFRDLTQWYDWQKTLLEQEIAANDGDILSTKVELRLPGTGNGLTRHGGQGVCTLNREGLTYTGTMDGEEVELHFSLQRIYRLLFGAGENFEIYDGTRILYFVPEERRSAVDWYIASMILYDAMNT
jgi:1-acyl-sn-glycerol-3-phosphate acyltransferase